MNTFGLYEFSLGDRHKELFNTGLTLEMLNKIEDELHKDTKYIEVTENMFVPENMVLDKPKYKVLRKTSFPMQRDEGDDLITTIRPDIQEVSNVFMTPEELSEYRWRAMALGSFIMAIMLTVVMLSIRYFNG